MIRPRIVTVAVIRERAFRLAGVNNHNGEVDRRRRVLAPLLVLVGDLVLLVAALLPLRLLGLLGLPGNLLFPAGNFVLLRVVGPTAMDMVVVIGRLTAAATTAALAAVATAAGYRGLVMVLVVTLLAARRRSPCIAGIFAALFVGVRARLMQLAILAIGAVELRLAVIASTMFSLLRLTRLKLERAVKL